MRYLMSVTFFLVFASLGFMEMKQKAAIDARRLEVGARYARQDGEALEKMSLELLAEALRKHQIERITEQAVDRMRRSPSEAAPQSPSLMHVADLNTITDRLYKNFSFIGQVLGTITDRESASSALPSLQKASDTIDILFNQMNQIPPGARTPIPGIISAGMSTLEPPIEEANAIPGVDNLIGRVSTPMLEKLELMAG